MDSPKSEAAEVSFFDHSHVMHLVHDDEEQQRPDADGFVVGCAAGVEHVFGKGLEHEDIGSPLCIELSGYHFQRQVVVIGFQRVAVFIKPGQ